MIAIFTLWKYRQQLFQIKSRALIVSLLSIKMFFVMIHYSLGLPSNYAIVFVIIQEFFKISAFLYVIYFYLKHAVDYTENENGRKFVSFLRVGFATFTLGLFVTLFIWAILRLTRVITTDPCRDYLWLVYRAATLALIVCVMISGYIIQRKVRARTKSLYGTTNPAIVNPGTEPSTGKFFIDRPKETGDDSSEEESENQYYVTSSVIRQMDAINKSLCNMWLCFITIIFVCTFDVTYNIYWQSRSDFSR